VSLFFRVSTVVLCVVLSDADSRWRHAGPSVCGSGETLDASVSRVASTPEE
jgi:hypothetical protein